MFPASNATISTFITYTLVGARASPTWEVPNYEQIICSCDYVTRSIAVEGMSRCDCLPATHMILQRGPTGTLLVMDGGPEFCSYMMRPSDENGCGYCYASVSASNSMASEPGSLCVVPFSSCAVVGLNAHVYNDSSGVLTVTWLNRAAYITITVYGSRHRHHHVQLPSSSSTPSSSSSFSSSSETRPDPHLLNTGTDYYYCPCRQPAYGTRVGIPAGTNLDRQVADESTFKTDNVPHGEGGGKDGDGDDDEREETPAAETVDDDATCSKTTTVGGTAIDLLAEVMREAELDAVVTDYDSSIAIEAVAAEEEEENDRKDEPGKMEEVGAPTVLGFDTRYDSLDFMDAEPLCSFTEDE